MVLFQSTLQTKPVAAQADYIISRYEASFEPITNQNGEMRDVATTLLIEYDIASGSKSDGFKFVGNNQIENISVTDGAGQPLSFTQEKMDETRINWQFPEVTQGKQTVIVKFTIKKCNSREHG